MSKTSSKIIIDLDISILIEGVVLEDLPLRLLALYLLYDSIVRCCQRLMRFISAHRLYNGCGLRTLLFLGLQCFFMLLCLEFRDRVEKLYDSLGSNDLELTFVRFIVNGGDVAAHES
jgi:hypothetical protein